MNDTCVFQTKVIASHYGVFEFGIECLTHGMPGFPTSSLPTKEREARWKGCATELERRLTEIVNGGR